MGEYVFSGKTEIPGHLFPKEISERDWIGYHGTSAAYSSMIEENGLEITSVISNANLNILVKEAKNLGISTNSVDVFRNKHSLSFSPLSEACLHYAYGDRFGGQGLLFVSQLVDDVLKTGTYDEDDIVLTTLNAIESEIANIRAYAPIIYAINLEGLSTLDYQSTTKAVNSKARIEASRIIAKMVLPMTKPADILSLSELNILTTRMQFAEGNYINYLYEQGKTE